MLLVYRLTANVNLQMPKAFIVFASLSRRQPDVQFYWLCISYASYAYNSSPWSISPVLWYEMLFVANVRCSTRHVVLQDLPTCAIEFSKKKGPLIIPKHPFKC